MSDKLLAAVYERKIARGHFITSCALAVMATAWGITLFVFKPSEAVSDVTHAWWLIIMIVVVSFWVILMVIVTTDWSLRRKREQAYDQVAHDQAEELQKLHDAAKATPTP